MLLAVVIPFFKIEFFEDTMKSLANQSVKEFKVYVGNDGSPENPLDILGRFEEKLDIIYKKFEKNLGATCLTGHWTRCINMTEGEKWIMILGDDDILGDNVVRDWYRFYNHFDARTNIIRFSSRLIDEKSHPERKVYNHPRWESSTDSFIRKIENKTRSSLSEYIFRKSIYEKHKFKNFPLGWFSDDRAWIDFSDGKPIFSINESVVSIRVSSLSISGNRKNKELKIEASEMFYRSLIKEKLLNFSPIQREYILSNYEKIPKINSSNVNSWFVLFFILLKYSDFKVIQMFVKRSLKKVYES